MGGNASPKNDLYNLLIGTYTNGKSEGIYVFEFNQNTGYLSYKSQITNVKNPSFLAISPNRNVVYAVNEINGENAGSVSSFSFNSLSGDLQFINKVPSHGSDPCYLEINGNILAVGNYSSGSAAIFELNRDGSIGALLRTIEHHGSGANIERQSGPHIHCTTFGSDGEYLFAVDLGIDKVIRYSVNGIFHNGPLQGITAIETEAGAGPRHLIFNKANTIAYLITELSGSIHVYDISQDKPILRQTVVLAQNNFSGAVSGGEIQFSPCEKFLYASNRAAANELVVLRIVEYGLLEPIQHISCGGRTPRHFALSENGKFVLVANKDSANISIFQRDSQTGILTATDMNLEIDQPSFVLLTPIEE